MSEQKKSIGEAFRVAEELEKPPTMEKSLQDELREEQRRHRYDS